MSFDSANTLCLIPARGGSKRFPRKNIADLRGKPVLSYAVEAAKGSGLFNEVWVSTEDTEIADVAESAGATLHSRDESLATDTSTLMDLSLSFLQERRAAGQEVDLFCLILPTAVLMLPEDLQGGLSLLEERQADFCMATTTYLEPPFWALHEKEGFLKSFFGDDYMVASQKLPDVCVDSGYFYFARTEALERERTWYGEKVVGFPIPRMRSVDIDEPHHLELAEAFLAYQQAGQPS